MPAHLVSFFHHEQWAILILMTLICTAATYAAIGLTETISAASEVTLTPLTIAAIELGLAIVATQYVILLALLPSGDLGFGSVWVASSVFAAVCGSALGLSIAARWPEHAVAAGAIVGLTAAAANYASLRAVGAPIEARHHLPVVILGLLAGILFDSGAFAIVGKASSPRARLAGAVLITLGVMSLSFFCSIESGLRHIAVGSGVAGDILEDWITVSVVPTALLLLILAIMSSYAGRYIRVLAQTRHRLEHALAQAERANESRGKFLAHMSHELRTPLNAINGFSDLMQQEIFGQLDRRYREYAQIIHNSGSHLLSLVNQVLDLAKIDAGEMRLQEDDIDVSREITACARLMADQMKRKKIIFSCDTVTDMPALYGDGRIFRQILLNLLGNAVKFTPERGQVRLSVEVDERGLLLTISDTGIGIAPADVPRVFERFRQVDTPYTRSYGGTGLGLPLVKEFVEAHQGVVSIASVLGEGTVVVIIFPTARLRKTAHASRGASPRRISGTLSGSVRSPT